MYDANDGHTYALHHGTSNTTVAHVRSMDNPAIFTFLGAEWSACLA